MDGVGRRHRKVTWNVVVECWHGNRLGTLRILDFLPKKVTGRLLRRSVASHINTYVERIRLTLRDREEVTDDQILAPREFETGSKIFWREVPSATSRYCLWEYSEITTHLDDAKPCSESDREKRAPSRRSRPRGDRTPLRPLRLPPVLEERRRWQLMMDDG